MCCADQLNSQSICDGGRRLLPAKLETLGSDAKIPKAVTREGA
jgi:hypothetical protein